MPQTAPPPQSEAELIERARAIAGQTLGQLAGELGYAVPPNLLRHKGWVGQLIEAALGADAHSTAEPDFTAIGVELKSVPLDARGLPRESTYVCTVPLEEAIGERWEDSWLHRKLSRVLWLPIEADPQLPLAERHIGNALLWSPSPAEELLLRTDWEELMEMVCLGQLSAVTARFGQVLQIRPKAANARVLRRGIGAEGERVLTNPRGFYLRPAFTAAILQRHYLTQN